MKLERVGPTPQFWKFGTDYYLLTDELLEKGPPVYLQRRKPLKIPSYQRNIVWRGKEITDLLDSKSELFGGVILVERTEILKLRDHPFELVDGLQRFATVTASLNELYPLVLSADPSRPDISDCFANLRMDVQNSQPIFSHNDTALRSHRRSALKKSYLELCSEVRKIILDNISDRQKASIFASKIEGMFLEKQIAIDEYHGFSGETDLTNTFITMNSKGVDLSPIDLLRAIILDHVLSLKWSEKSIEEMENEFTETFESSEAKNELKVIGKILYDVIRKSPRDIFTNWGNLAKADIDNLLDLIDTTVTSARGYDHECFSPYLSEIFQCGGLPFAITTLYFYKMYTERGQAINYVQSDISCILRLILRAAYRRVLDGTIGKIGPLGEKVMRGIIKTPEQLASEMMPSLSGSIDNEPDGEWLRERLREADRNDSKRVFNMYMLPIRSNLSSEFEPLRYGRGGNDFSIDHIIPQGSYGAGDVKIFDKGTFKMESYEEEKKIVVNIIGKKLNGRYCLLHFKPNEKNWLFFKVKH